MRLENVTGRKVEEYLKTSTSVVIPVGCLENHGKHMPLGTDTLIPNKIVELLEERCNVMVAPTIPYGATNTINGCPGTVTIGTDGLKMILERVINGLYRYGFRKFLILNGHGGNNKAIENVGIEMFEKGAMVANLNWWLMAGELNPAWKGGHGGGEETAGVMGVDPNLIDYDYIHEGMDMIDDIAPNMPSIGWGSVSFKGATVVIPRENRHYMGNGWWGPDHPETATKEWGDEMLRTFADYMADFVVEFEKVALPVPDGK